MKTIEYFRGVMKEAHKGLGAAVKDLTDAQLHFRPLEAGHSIAFTLWHYVRTEDIMIHVFLQNKKPVWNTEGWDQKLGMDAKSQGTGMTAEQAAAIRIKNLGEFLKYAERVFLASEGFLEGVPEESLDEVKEFPVIGKRSVRQIIGGMVLQHGANHMGEISYIKGLLGLKGSPI